MIGTMQTLTLLLTLLATARATRLITDDRITRAPRHAVVRWSFAHSKREDGGLLAYLVFCPWCVSVYVGAGAGALWWAWGDTRIYTAAVLALAASHVAGLLAGLERD